MLKSRFMSAAWNRLAVLIVLAACTENPGTNRVGGGGDQGSAGSGGPGGGKGGSAGANATHAGSGGIEGGGTSGGTTGAAGGGPSGGTAGTAGGTELSRERVMRIQVDWTPEDGFTTTSGVKELSGTEALAKRARREDRLGSFIGIVSDPATQEPIFQQTIGIGYRYMPALRAVTFRFPELEQPFLFTLKGENEETGATETVLETTLDPATFSALATQEVELVSLREAMQEPALIVNFYAEGYPANGRDRFLTDARSMVDMLEDGLPEQERMEFRAVWSPSNVALGSAQNLGSPVAERDSFLGLYYPYWMGYHRWQVIVYPTREKRFRDAIGQVPYDYPIAILDTSVYTNVGNYNELTAVANGTGQVRTLLLHEIGHFFGLNEEYSSSGTELTFSPGVTEPWSQNMTWNPDRGTLKWGALVDADTPIPTPSSAWMGENIGAYPGGYGGDDERTHIPVPPGACVMSTGDDFCAVCGAAIADKIKFDLGE